MLLAASVPVIMDTARGACASCCLRSLKKFTDKIFNRFSPLVTYWCPQSEGIWRNSHILLFPYKTSRRIFLVWAGDLWAVGCAAIRTTSPSPPCRGCPCWGDPGALGDRAHPVLQCVPCPAAVAAARAASPPRSPQQGPPQLCWCSRGSSAWPMAGDAPCPPAATPPGITSHYPALYSTAWHCIPLPGTASHCPALHPTEKRCIPLPSITFHDPAPHPTTQHHIPPPSITSHHVASLLGMEHGTAALPGCSGTVQVSL